MAEYNLFEKVGKTAMPLCDVLNIYLDNNKKPVDKILEIIRTEDKNYSLRIENEAKIINMQVNKTYDSGARRSRR